MAALEAQEFKIMETVTKKKSRLKETSLDELILKSKRFKDLANRYNEIINGETKEINSYANDNYMIEENIEYRY